MNIVTFNLRYDNPEDGKNMFAQRKTLIKKTIEERSPDIIGFQEALPHMSEWLKQNLCAYYIIGHGREKDLSGEQVLIAYKKTAYNLHYSETFWLSPTPSVPGSRYRGQSCCPRTCIYAVFEDAEHNLFRVFNTHLDHTGKSARRHALEQILHKAAADTEARRVLPLILMGDFNAVPGQSELQPLFNSGCTLPRLFDMSAGSGGTFHNFGKAIPEKIDYIFACTAFKAESCSLWKVCENGLYISDHYPVEVQAFFNRDF